MSRSSATRPFSASSTITTLGTQYATPLLARVLIIFDDQNTKRRA